MRRVGVWLFVDYKKQTENCAKDFPDSKHGMIQAKNYAILLNKRKFKSERGIVGDKQRGIATQFYGIEVFDKKKSEDISLAQGA